MIRHIVDYEEYTVWEIKKDSIYEYWISNKENTVMVYAFGSDERFTIDGITILANNGYFNVQEIEIGRF